MIFSNSKFLTSSFVPLNQLSEVVFIGRSNVGKSSLINALCNNQSLAFVSKTPGHTKMLNYFLIGNKFYFVDAPGYGFRKLHKTEDNFDVLMSDYFTKNTCLKLAILLLDARRELSSDDIEMLKYLKEFNIHSLIVFTKADKLNQSLRQKALNNAHNIFPNEEVYFVSSLNKKGIDKLQEAIIKSLNI